MYIIQNKRDRSVFRTDGKMKGFYCFAPDEVTHPVEFDSESEAQEYADENLHIGGMFPVTPEVVKK